MPPANFTRGLGRAAHASARLLGGLLAGLLLLLTFFLVLLPAGLVGRLVGSVRRGAARDSTWRDAPPPGAPDSYRDPF